MSDDIKRLKNLIEDYEDECLALAEMRNAWEEHDDSGSDPGLQFEQEQIRDEAYNQIINFATLLTRR